MYSLICTRRFEAPCSTVLQTHHKKYVDEGKKFSHVVHKGLKSEVEELKMHCLHHALGCGWIGQLGGDFQAHRTSKNGCGYERVECSNKCTDSNWGSLVIHKYVYRKDLKNLLDKQCANRRYLCKYCFKIDTYEIITKYHYSECPEHPISCPNLGCSIAGIKRKELHDHLKVCPEELVECPFAEAGCKERVCRSQLDDHTTSSVQNHLVMLMGAYKDMKRRLDKLESASKPKAKRAKLS